jgi:hypothetical protein
MAIADVLILGLIVFDNFSPPECMPFGGSHMMVILKLIGGQRVIDTLGPDDENIERNGRFVGAGAYDTCLALDSLRASGQQLPLSFAGQDMQSSLDRSMPIFGACRYGLNIRSRA